MPVRRGHSAVHRAFTGYPALLPSRLAAVFGVLSVLAAVPLLAVAVSLWRFGGRVVRSQRFPPPGVSVIRPTPVLHGQDAEQRGRRLRWFAVVLVVLTGALIVQLWLVASVVAPV